MDADLTPKPVGLYLHIPYCASLCGYCDFARTLTPEGGVPTSFDDALCLDLARYGETPPISLDSVYFGGGTPSLLPPERIHRLMALIHQLFSLSPECEVTLEANPETLSPETAEAWRSAGITRLSLGVQSLEEDELALLERRASPLQARRAVEIAAAANFTRLSVDVMVGIPGQTAYSLAHTLEAISAWPVDHLSAYLLDLHPNTPLYERFRRGEFSLPDEDASADLYHLLCDRAEAAGFPQYELSNFARPGGESRHNLKYWRRHDTIGVGPSAHGFFRGMSTANYRSMGQWREALRSGSTPFETASTLTPGEHLENRVIFGLRLTEGVEDSLLAAFLAAVGKDAGATLAPLFGHGYLARTDTGRLRLTRLGFLASNEVLAYLLPPGWRAE